VLIIGFSGSGAGFVFGFAFVELAGFHIADTSFQIFLGSAQPAIPPLLFILIGYCGNQLKALAR